MLLSISTKKITLIVCLILLYGCESNNRPNNSSSLETNDQNELNLFYEGYGTLLCNLNAQCRFGILPLDVIRCKEWINDEPSFLPGRNQSRKHRLDQELAKNCMNSLTNATCEDLQNMLNSDNSVLEKDCPEAIKGFVKLGESCLESRECSPGLRCSYRGENCGTCVPNLEECGAAYCAKDQYCNTADTCENRKPEGTSCVDNEECTANLFCIENTCQYGQDLGQSCGREGYANDPCKEGISCVFVEYNENNWPIGVCQKKRYDKMIGESCDLTTNMCGAELFCDETTSACAPELPNGQNCTEGSYCSLGSVCLEGTCVSQLLVGSSCTDNQQCITRLCNNGACERYEHTPEPICQITSDTDNNVDDIINAVETLYQDTE